MLTQDLVLGIHDTGQCAHQHSAFACQIAVNFLFKGGGEKVTRADGNANGQCAFNSTPGIVLENGIAGVDAGACKEIPPYTGP